MQSRLRHRWPDNSGKEVGWVPERSGSARKLRPTRGRSVSGRTGTRSASARPEHAAEAPAPRLIGRAHLDHGRWLFDPARRWRGGKRALIWKGAHAPEDGDYCIAEVPED